MHVSTRTDASPTPRPTSADALFAGWAALDRWISSVATTPPDPRHPWAVAYSGGADSTALLRAVHTRWPQGVVAFHVHHGLQDAADGFEAHTRDVCATLGVAWHGKRVQAAHAPGQSPEDAARRARYRALAGLAHQVGVRWVLLAQHAEDQAETLMMALMRGSGLPGLSAMPAGFARDGVWFGRPWLDLPGRALRAWLQESGHGWMEDPSNVDVRFTRNRLRQRLMPVFGELSPGFEARLARSAQHAAQAQRLLDALAAQDLERVGQPPEIKALQQLDADRQTNVLRFWLRGVAGTAPSTAQLAALLPQIAVCRTRGHRIHLRMAGGWVERAGPCLVYGAQTYNP